MGFVSILRSRSCLNPYTRKVVSVLRGLNSLGSYFSSNAGHGPKVVVIKFLKFASPTSSTIPFEKNVAF